MLEVQPTGYFKGLRVAFRLHKARLAAELHQAVGCHDVLAAARELSAASGAYGPESVESARLRRAVYVYCLRGQCARRGQGQYKGQSQYK